MKKIKILEVHAATFCDYCDEGGIDYRITDWDEVTEEQFIQLKEWVTRKNAYMHRISGRRKKVFHILVSPPNPEVVISNAVSEYLEMMKKDAQREAARKKAIEKAVETKRKKREEREKKQLERLRAKYEEGEKKNARARS